MNKSFPLLIVLLITVFFACTERTYRQEPERVDFQIDSLTKIITRQNNNIDSLKNLLKENKSEAGGYPVFFGKKYEEIINPPQYIKKALREQPQLIPLKAVLGGSMQFRKLEVVSEHWILAIYDDGHIQGKSIYEYELQPDGSLEFTRVVSQQ